MKQFLNNIKTKIIGRCYIIYYSIKISRLEKIILKMEKLGYITTSGVSVFEKMYRPEIDKLKLLKSLCELAVSNP